MLRRPETFPRGSAARRSRRVSKTPVQGLIHIVAELGAPSA